MDYSAGELIKLLPCMHYYHLRCIDDWLMRSLTCPSCMERVDAGLITTLRSSGSVGGGGGGNGNNGSRSRGFSLRRRRRGRGSRGSETESPLMSGNGSSRSSSRSSSTSSINEHLINPGGQISWQGAPLGHSNGPIFLPPFPPSSQSPHRSLNSQRPPTSQNFPDLGPPPCVVMNPTTPTNSNPPPHSPLLPPLANITIHTPPPPQNTHTNQATAN